MASYTPATAVAAGDEEEAACLQAFELMCAFTVPMTLKAAIELGLLDALVTAADDDDGRALTANELAARLPDALDKAEAASSVDRMMRLLASCNVVKCSTEAGPAGEPLRPRYSPAPVCRWFTAGGNSHHGSLAPSVLFGIDEDYLSTWHQLAAAVGGGGAVAFERAHGAPMFEYMGTNRRLNTLFNQAMAQQSMIVINKLLDRFHGFDGVGVLVDVGGGTGGTLEMIMSRHKHITGVNFDLPHSILHLQNDEDCIKILKNCHQALSDNGKVIAVEIVLPAIPEPVPTAQYPFQMDMIMLNNFRGGKERTELEFTKLAMDSSFSGTLRTTYIFANYWALEFNK
uniref:O-methyltransferase domain-containing protein n=1 Tax=Oryza glumipatula TaxID=40148 RepID=A0A0D9ZH25_9ORYZ